MSNGIQTLIQADLTALTNAAADLAHAEVLQHGEVVGELLAVEDRVIRNKDLVAKGSESRDVEADLSEDVRVDVEDRPAVLGTKFVRSS